MQIKELKERLFEAIEAETDISVLEEFQEYLSISKVHHDSGFQWEDTKEFNDALDESIRQAERGEVMLHDEVMQIIKSKFLEKNCLD